MTERLTVSGATTQRDIDKLLELSNENQFGRNEAYYKLQYYEDLEEQGRLVELPCKIGDTVYGHFQCYDGKEIRECKVIGIRACQFKANSECYYFVDVEFNIIDPFYKDGRLMTCRQQAAIGNDYGSWERVFFTCEEVETALKGAEE